MDSNKTIMYALLTLNRKNDIIKIVNLNSPIINKYIDYIIESNRNDIPFINAMEDGYINENTIFSDEDNNAIIFFESNFKLMASGMIHEYTKIRIVDKKLYDTLIKENNIDKIINMCMAIKPKYDYGVMMPNDITIWKEI